MAGYADLIREYKEETKYANDTFTDIYECVNSIGLYVNENVDFSCTISINEINFDNAKETLKNFKDKIVDAARKLVERIQKFTEKIGQAIKRLVDKAKVVVASKGNAAMAKILEKNGDKLLNKDVEITIFDSKSVIAIIKKCEIALTRLEGFAKIAADNTETVLKAEEEYNKYKPTVDSLNKMLDSGDEDFKKAVAKKITIKKGESVKQVYNTYIAKLMDSIDPKSASSTVSACNKRIDKILDVCKEGKTALDKFIKSIDRKERKADENGYVKSAQTYIKLLADVYSNTMIISHKVLDVTFKTLTMSTKASAQLALGAAGKTKEKEEK